VSAPLDELLELLRAHAVKHAIGLALAVPLVLDGLLPHSCDSSARISPPAE